MMPKEHDARGWTHNTLPLPETGTGARARNPLSASVGGHLLPGRFRTSSVPFIGGSLVSSASHVVVSTVGTLRRR